MISFCFSFVNWRVFLMTSNVHVSCFYCLLPVITFLPYALVGKDECMEYSNEYIIFSEIYDLDLMQHCSSPPEPHTKSRRIISRYNCI